MKFCRMCDAPTHGQANYCDDCRGQTRISARDNPSVVPLSTEHDHEVFRPLRAVNATTQLEFGLQWQIANPWRLYCYGWQKRRHIT